MNNQPVINVFSEHGKLKSVLVHRPGKEVENLAPEYLERLLFDDIPYLKLAREEHDIFCQHMRDNGVEVLYIEKLMTELLDHHKNLKMPFVEQFLDEANLYPGHRDALKAHYLKMRNSDMVNEMIAGTETRDLGLTHPDKYPFAADPLPNLLFQRDPHANIGNGATIHRMENETRRRETIFADYVFRNHPRFVNQINFYYNRQMKDSLEGGDIMVLSKKILIVGATERTSLEAIEKLAQNVLNDTASSFEKVYAFEVPKKRAFMHLDTVLTCIDINKFLIHPLIFDYMDQFKIYEIGADGKRHATGQDLEQFFTKVFGKKPVLIRCGGDSPIDAGREQWNDGTNVITIAPGKVIAYSRNHVTNKLLRKAGITVIETPSSELSRGRGGPRCMTMPIIRENTCCCTLPSDWKGTE